MSGGVVIIMFVIMPGVRVHQVRKLADLGKPGQPRPAWAELMARRRRKTLVVCPSCHDTIHGQPAPLLAS